MIKYHGTPITPMQIFHKSMKNKNILVSFAHPADIDRALDTADKIILDNGAFSFWTKNKKPNWGKYYDWVSKYYDRIEFYIIPDVIDGTEEENDDLLIKDKKAVPVWHVAESFDRLKRLMNDYAYIAIGSSGEYTQLGTNQWHKRMNDVMKIICDDKGRTLVDIHMLRCLDPRIFTKYPFTSGDSTNLARNHARDGWRQILERIEPYDSPKTFNFRTYYETASLFDCA